MNEKRFILAFTISLLILFAYPYFLQKIYPPKIQHPVTESAAAPMPAQAKPNEPAVTDTSSAPAGEEKKFDYEDSIYTATFTNIGGAISALSLKAFINGRAHGNYLLDDQKEAVRGFAVRILENGAWKEDAYTLEKKDKYAVIFLKEEPNALRIRKSYWFLPEQPYVFVVEVNVENLSQETRRLEYELVAPLFVGDEHGKGQPYLEADYVKDGEMEVRPAQKIIKNGFLKEGPLDWIALEKKYFTMIVKPESAVEHVRSSGSDQALVHYIKPQPLEIPAGGSVSQKFFVYAGPKNYEALKNTRFGFEKILHTKFLGGLWIYFLILLKFFYKMFHNYGIAIIVLSSLIKLLFAPLTHMSFDSMRRMQDLQPKLKHLQEQYKNDPQRLNKEVMELYKKNKVNPFGGCLPMVLQMPIFVALYQTFSSAIELRGAPFFAWIKDLSEPDQLFLMPFSLPVLGNQINLLPLIMLGTMVWQQKLTPQPAATEEQKMMTNIMPIMFGFIFYGLPSGLVIYWIVNNVLTVLHQLFMRKLHISPAA